jgi:hypothetical protein
MTQIGLAKDIFSELICANGPSCQKAYGRGCGKPGGSIDLARNRVASERLYCSICSPPAGRQAGAFR